MTQDNLRQFLQRYAQLKEDQNLRPGKDTLTSEFQKIKRESEQLIVEGQTIASQGAREINRKKNRYKDILPFDHSRVILRRQGDGADYINANYIMSPSGKKGYIASQGPMPSTVDDFWRMIWQHKVKVIVMACKEIELGKHRCQRYWPLQGEQLNFDGITATLVKEEIIADSLSERIISAVDGKESLEITQLHYTAWPDHGVPKTTKDLIKIIESIRERHPWDDPPVLMHCSAGCGRTGVMVAVDYGRRLLRKSPESFDVYDIVMTLRKQRPAMVQSKEQYEYLHDVFKDLIEEHLQKAISTSSYVNLDFSGTTKKVPLYENLDAIHMASPKVRQPRTSPTNDDVKEVLNLERFAQAKKPVVNNFTNPQKALIKNEIPTPRPKPLPKPVKVVNLMDNDPNFPSDFQLQSPLLPSTSQATSNQTVELRKPSLSTAYPSQNNTKHDSTDAMKSIAGKDSTQQNYINVEIGPPKLPLKPTISSEKPHLPPKKPDEKPIITKKPNPLSKSCDDIFKQPSAPKPQVKPKHLSETSAKDTVDGIRPALPLKLKDLSEFDSIFSPEPKDKSNGKDIFGNDSFNSKIGKARTFGRESTEARAARLDLWNKYSPDYEVATIGSANRIPEADYAVVGSFSSNPGPNISKVVPKAFNCTQDVPVFTEQNKNSKPLKTGGHANERKLLSNDEIFPPFEPASSVRVSPTPKEPKKDNLVGLRSNSAAAKNGLVRADQREVGSDSSGFQRRDGLVKRTNQSVVRAESKSDGVVQNTSYVVSIQKTKQDSSPQRKPLAHKPHSLQTLSANDEPKEVPRPRRLFSEDPQMRLNNQIIDGTDDVDLGSLYAVVDKKSPKNEDQSLYEVIWTKAKPKPNISERPQLNVDEPPSLPPRTAESYVFEDDDSNQIGTKQGDMQDGAAHANDASGEQSSFQWLSAGVGKLKKLTNIKGALSVGLRPNMRQSSHPEINNSAFYTPTPTAKDQSSNLARDGRSSPLPGTIEKVFPLRLQQKPRGPRPIPNHWTPM